ncbi:type II toxin-antitoxin system HicB family antitoxin [Phocaeicola sp.]
MNTLKYKGYIGTVNYSDEDEVFFGKVEGINGLVTFEGESVKELKTAFEEAVDDYLAYCKEKGISPAKKYSGILNIHISPDVHSRIAKLALETGTTINSYIKNALEQQIKLAH